jgi:hypothetical protein
MTESHIADELERLLALPLETELDVAAWQRAAAALKESLRSDHSEIALEGETYHFLVDAEIRQRDVGYRLWQEGQVRTYIQRVRRSHEKDIT